VSEARVRPGAPFGWHSHPRGALAVVVDGAVRKRFKRRTTEAGQGTVVVTPPEELHEDSFGRDGTALIILESEDGFDSCSSFTDWGALLVALRIDRELHVDDAFSPLALEGLALELTATAGRGPSARPPGRWTREAYELIHERFREMPTLTEIAGQVGVHPSHLARSFRAHYRESIGECARRLRLEWAASRLIGSDVPLASLAIEAGFVDQSHFTRAFKRRFGITPARYRAAHR
jgi:AraC family transcriptional regulator